MAAPPCSAVLLLSLAALLLSTSAAKSSSASAPGPAPESINITGILDKAGQYTYFIRLLNQNQAAIQIDIQSETSTDGMTVFAPTDNAFNNLHAGTLNNLTSKQQIQLVQYHVCPKFYTSQSFETVSNPVRTQASGQDNRVFGLNISATANQVNISSGIVDVSINNVIRKEFPLAIYEIDSVLIPSEFYEAPPPVPAVAPSPSRSHSRDADIAPSTEDSRSSSAGKFGIGVFLSVICLIGYAWVY